MSDHSIWQNILPALIAVSVTTTILSRQRAAFEKEIRRLLTETFPRFDISSITPNLIIVRYQGKLYEISANPLLKIFQKKKDKLAEALETELIRLTGSTPEQLREARATVPASASELSFDKADLGDSSTTVSNCAVCQKSLTDEYFDVNGKPTCGTCKDTVVAVFTGGSRWKYVPQAFLYGSGMAALGCLIYYGIRAATGYEFGLVAVVVGLMVGGAVRKASHQRGGPVFQTIAMFLTYTAIVLTYAPALFQGLNEGFAKKAATVQGKGALVAASTDSLKQQSPAIPAPGKTPVSPTVVQPPSKALVTSTGSAPSAMPAGTSGVPNGPGKPASTQADKDRIHRIPIPLRAMIGILFIIGLLYAVPVLAGVHNLMGLFIIGIALYEAWKINKRPPLNIAGPFRLGRS